jgi:hypothetical protein
LKARAQAKPDLGLLDAYMKMNDPQELLKLWDRLSEVSINVKLDVLILRYFRWMI